MASIQILRKPSLLQVKSNISTRGQILFFHGYGQSCRDALPLSFLLAEAGYSVLIPDLPGHGLHPDILSTDLLLSFSAHCLETFHPDILLGYSLGARLALALPAPGPIIAISPPLPTSFNEKKTRKLLLQHLRPRWVREEKPMQTLANCLTDLSLEPHRGREPTLFIKAQKDLPCLISAPFQVIPNTDHSSILFSEKTAHYISEWLHQTLDAYQKNSQMNVNANLKKSLKKNSKKNFKTNPRTDGG